MSNINIDYQMSPTAEKFHMDPSPFRALIGPVGGGKTVALCMEVLRLAIAQEADHNEYFYPKRQGAGVRPSRWLLVRATYPQLKSTLIKTWNEWTGKLGRVVYDSPIRFEAEFPLDDGTTVLLEVLFMALDNGRGAENLRSLEVTGIGFSEFAEIGPEVVEMASTRIGRYPKTKKDESTGEILYGPTRPCMIGESNPPSERSHWYNLFEVQRPAGTRVFKQPPAMLYDHQTETYSPNPEAENISHLPKGYGYYQNIIDSGATTEFLSVYVLNNYGSIFKGKPVYPAFNTRHHMLGDGEYHLTEEEKGKLFNPDRRQMILGMDLGLNPAAAFVQENAMGGLTVYDEVAPEDVRFEDFIQDFIIPTLNQRFQGLTVAVCYDPSNPRSSLSNRTAAEMLRERGFQAFPAPSNDPTYRIEAVNFYLQRPDLFKVHPRCTTIKAGFTGGYNFEEVRGRDGVFKDEPTKNQFSHIMNGLEYACSYYYYQARKRMHKVRRINAGAGGSRRKGFHYV